MLFRFLCDLEAKGLYIESQVKRGFYERPEVFQKPTKQCLTSLDHIVLYGNLQAINL